MTVNRYSIHLRSIYLSCHAVLSSSASAAMKSSKDPSRYLHPLKLAMPLPTIHCHAMTPYQAVSGRN